MSSNSDSTPDVVFLYAAFWRMLSLAVHRYGSSPTGQLLMVISMILLDRFGYQPTVTELANITRLPKSSVSRYVAAEMNAGMLEEFIDPHDRRRRRLRPTDKARVEQKWHARTALEIHQQLEALDLDDSAKGASGTDIVRLLMQLNLDLLAKVDAESDRSA